MARRAVVRLGVPALIVAVMAVIALWRIGPPPQQGSAVGTAGGRVEEKFAVGREASLEHITIRERVGDRYFWVGSGDERPVFVVLDPDVKRSTTITLRPGARVTLIGIVRPVPTAVEAERRWRISTAAAALVAESGTYVHVTEIR